MAATANQKIQAMDPGGLRTGLADAVDLFEGAICFFERTSAANEGYITHACDSGNNNFAGVVKKEVDNDGGSAGDEAVEFYTRGAFVFEGTGFHMGLVGDKAYASDNFTVTESSSSTSLIGKFIEYISTTKMRVEIESASDTGG